MEPKTILITGATDGLGRAVAEGLASQGHTLLLHGRDQGRLDAARELDTTVRTYRADLASLEAVRRLGDELLDAEERIDVLIANAGVGGGGERQESVDGYELNFAVNYLSQFLLVTRLLDRLRASAPARVVLVSSLGQTPVDFDDVMLERGYSSARAYRQSKLAQIAFGLRLARQVDPAEVTVTSLHPATLMPTKMVLAAGASPADSLQSGAAATARLAVDPDLVGLSGAFFDRDRQVPPHTWASDPEVQEQLWRLSEQLTKPEDQPAPGAGAFSR